MRYRRWIGIGAGIILGLIFIISGLGKLLHQADFLEVVLNDSFVPPALAHMVAYMLPWIEFILGALLIIGISAKLMASFSSVLIAAFIAHNGWLIAQGLADEDCGCFGIFEKVFLGKMSTMEALYFDIGLAGLVLIILFCYPGKFLDIHPWFFRKRQG